MSIPTVVGTPVTSSGHISLEAWTVPAGVVADDLLVAFTNANTVGYTITPPAGWTLDAATTRSATYSRTATGGEGGVTYTNLAQSHTDSWTSFCLVIRGVDPNAVLATSFGNGTTEYPGVGGTVSFTALGSYQSTIDALISVERLIVVAAGNTTDYNAFPATYGNPLANQPGNPESGVVTVEIGTGYSWQTFAHGSSYVPLNFTIGVDGAGIDGWGSYLLLNVLGFSASSGWGVLIS